MPDVLAICAALQWEIRPVLRSLRGIRRSRLETVRVWEGNSRDGPVVVFRTGIGWERSAAATSAVLDRFRAKAVINTGCAGALAHHLESGSLVIADRLVTDGDAADACDTDRDWTARLQAAVQKARLYAAGGTILTSRAVLATAAEKQAAARRYGAIAVDMEGAAVARVAAERRLPFAAARAILDAATTDLSLAQGLVEPDGASRPLRAAWRAVCRPAELPQLIALGKNARRAEEIIERLFRALLGHSVPAGTEFDD